MEQEHWVLIKFASELPMEVESNQGCDVRDSFNPTILPFSFSLKPVCRTRFSSSTSSFFLLLLFPFSFQWKPLMTPGILGWRGCIVTPAEGFSYLQNFTERRSEALASSVSESRRRKKKKTHRGQTMEGGKHSTVAQHFFTLKLHKCSRVSHLFKKPVNACDIWPFKSSFFTSCRTSLSHAHLPPHLSHLHYSHTNQSVPFQSPSARSTVCLHHQSGQHRLLSRTHSVCADPRAPEHLCSSDTLCAFRKKDQIRQKKVSLTWTPGFWV